MTTAAAFPTLKMDISRDAYRVSLPIRDVIRACCKGQSPWPLSLLGPVGTGKTCAALSIADHVQCTTLFVTMTEFCQKLIDAQQGNLWESIRVSEIKTTQARVWRGWEKLGLTIIDEIASRQSVSDHHRETLQRALDLREGKPMVITANLRIGDIDTLYGERVASRLSSGTIVWIDGADRRTAEDDRTTPTPRTVADIESEDRRREYAKSEQEYREGKERRIRCREIFAKLPPEERESIVSRADHVGGFSDSHMFDKLDWRSDPFSGKCRMVADVCSRIM